MYARQEQPYPIPQPLQQQNSNHSSASPTAHSSQQVMQHIPLGQAQQPYPTAGVPPVTPTHPYSGSRNGRQYSLRVEQQPIRARMCGFGDKDRRPITPPPCIRLVVTDMHGKEVDVNDVDSSFFVLTVDLWAADAAQEVNLVRHSSGAPTVSISTSTTTSYPPPPDRPYVAMPVHMVPPPYQHNGGYGHPMGAPPVQMPGYGAPSPMQQGYYPPTPVTPATPGGYPFSSPTGGPVYAPMAMQMPPAQPATGMFTRNLIGSLTVNAFKLTDTEGKMGFWFVLQDLSVRTEGQFRLKMNFVDVGSGDGTNTLNQGKAPVLASCFSDVFQVYSAKKFPGVIESTPLSKAFASQGIKIPIRKDGPKVSNAEEYDRDE